MSRILFLSRWFPDPPNNGSKLRIFHLLRGLAERHDVTLLTFHDPSEDPSAATALARFCTHVEAIPWKPYDPGALRARLGFLSLRPRFLVDTFSPAMSAALTRLLTAHRFDAVIASQIDMAVYGPAFCTLPAIFEEVEVTTLFEQANRATSPAARLRYGLTWFKHRRFLARLLRCYTAATVVSEQERRLLALAAPQFNAVSTIPNCVDMRRYQAFHGMGRDNQLIFTGSLTYNPNYEAMRWFLERVYPLVRQAVPDVHLTITGNHGGRRLPQREGVTLTGFVDDVRPLIAGAAASIAPIHTGGGTRLKILEAMALGAPIVSTGKGAEGLDIVPGEHFLLADDPVQFAHATVQLLTERQAARRLAGNARCQVERHYDWAAVMPRFLDLVESVIMRGDATPTQRPIGKEVWQS